MRILHVGKFYPPEYHGGLESVVVTISDELVRRGIDVTTVVAAVSGPTRSELIGGARIVRVRTAATILSQPIVPGMARAIRAEPADVVHLHHPNPLGDLALLRERRPIVVTQHSDIIRQAALSPLYRPLLARVMRRAAAITVGTAAYQQSSPELRGFESRISVIPFGIDPARFAGTGRVSDRAGELRAAWGDRPVILAVGRLVGYKGFDLLVQAARGLGAAVVLVGTGPEEARLRALAGPEVVFAGRVTEDDLVAHYHAADLFCLPSRTRAEAYGMVLLEAMACGLPLITARLPTGVSVINRDGITGRVVAVNDVAALREALLELLGNSSLRESMGRQAREVLEREYTASLMGDRFEALYRSLV